MWKFTEYQSGSCIVFSHIENYPYYYVYANEAIRRDVSIDLEVWLNHNKLPEWARNLKRHPEFNYIAIGEDNIEIIATGPMVLPPDDNGSMNWQQSNDPVHIQQRIDLIERLLD